MQCAHPLIPRDRTQEDLDATVQTVLSDSDAAKDLVRQNGQQALYVGLFAFTIEVIGFFGSLLARSALNRSIIDEEFHRGMQCDCSANSCALSRQAPIRVVFPLHEVAMLCIYGTWGSFDTRTVHAFPGIYADDLNLQLDELHKLDEGGLPDGPRGGIQRATSMKISRA